MQHVRTIYTVFLSLTWINHLLRLYIHFHICFLKPIMQPPSAESVHEQLKKEYLDSTWFRFNVVEPRIGDMDCPALAEDHGPRGQSCYIVFVTNRSPSDFGCIEERCIAFSVETIEAALRHQRAYHFGHNPFMCIPSSGELWYVFISYTPVVPCLGPSFVAVVSLPSVSACILCSDSLFLQW